MVIENFLEYIEFKGLKLSQVEKDLGISNGYIGKQRDRKGSIGSNIIEKIVYSFPDLRIEWLISGRGCMLKNSEINSVDPDKPPGPCEFCAQKDATIAALNKLVQSQFKTIELLDARQSEPKKSSGQKRKAG